MCVDAGLSRTMNVLDRLRLKISKLIKSAIMDSSPLETMVATFCLLYGPNGYGCMPAAGVCVHCPWQFWTALTDLVLWLYTLYWQSGREAPLFLVMAIVSRNVAYYGNVASAEPSPVCIWIEKYSSRKQHLPPKSQLTSSFDFVGRLRYRKRALNEIWLTSLALMFCSGHSTV